MFDITKHNFNGAKGVYAPNDETIALSPFGGFDFCTLDKNDAIAIAKHFGLLADNVLFTSQWKAELDLESTESISND